MKAVLRPVVLLCFVTLSLISKAQDRTVNYYNYIDAYNLSHLWANHKLNIFIDNHFEEINFPEPVGFIGNQYQRFYIHYTAVVKDPANPYNYFVKGKTRVGDTICSFKGTITVIGAYIDPQLYLGRYHRGQLICSIDLNEDPNQPGSGYFKGSMTTNWYLDKKEIHYDALDALSVGFSNNQCIATWTSYETHETKPCKWGDFRTPKGGDFDPGSHAFNVNQKFVSNESAHYKKVF